MRTTHTHSTEYHTTLTILKDGHGEFLRGVACQPKPEVLVRAVWDNDLLTDLLQLWHPAGG